MAGFTLGTDDLIKRMSSEDEIELTEAQLKQVQLVDFAMAKDVIECCEKNGVVYTLSGGTCLGAIRHGGFIPWDDDMDLNISRSGFSCLIRELKNTYGDKYYVVYPGGDMPVGFATGFVQKVGTRMRTLADVDKEHCGVSIDLFVVENAPDNRFIRCMHGLLCMAMGLFLSCRRYFELRDDILPSLEDGSDAKRSISAKVAIGRVLSFAKMSTWAKWTDAVYSLCKNENSEYVVIPAGRRHYFKETYKRSTFFPTKRASFNGMDWSVPGDADSYMRALYGADYMTPPPVNDRERHIVFEFDLGEYGANKEML